MKNKFTLALIFCLLLGQTFADKNNELLNRRKKAEKEYLKKQRENYLKKINYVKKKEIKDIPAGKFVALQQKVLFEYKDTVLVLGTGGLDFKANENFIPNILTSSSRRTPTAKHQASLELSLKNIGEGGIEISRISLIDTENVQFGDRQLNDEELVLDSNLDQAQRFIVRAKDSTKAYSFIVKLTYLVDGKDKKLEAKIKSSLPYKVNK